MEIINEDYRGTAYERVMIRTHLQGVRSGHFQGSLPLSECYSLNQLLADNAPQLEGFDPRLFEAFLGSSMAWFRRRAKSFPMLDPSRFFIGIVPEDSRDSGGFHSKHAKGFMYLGRYGWSVLAPDKININLFMDGITMLMTIASLKSSHQSLGLSDLNDMENRLTLDLTLRYELLPEGRRMRKFNDTVIAPTERFLEAWGGEPLRDLFFDAMITGRGREAMLELGRRRRTPIPCDAWKMSFMSPNWTE
jgi:hypothetical protein